MHEVFETAVYRQPLRGHLMFHRSDVDGDGKNVKDNFIDKTDVRHTIVAFTLRDRHQYVQDLTGPQYTQYRRHA